jgi:hypothetical protein
MNHFPSSHLILRISDMVKVIWGRFAIVEVCTIGLRAGRSGFYGSIPVGGWEPFSSPCPEQFWSPPSLLSGGYRGALSLGIKWPGREADHSPPSSAEVKNAWSYTSTPSQYVFMAWCLFKHRDNFIFYLPLQVETVHRNESLNYIIIYAMRSQDSSVV